MNEKSIIDELNQQIKELEQEKLFLNNVLDTSPNIVLVTNGFAILRANKTFYDFFGFDTLDEFTKNFGCLCQNFKLLD